MCGAKLILGPWRPATAACTGPSPLPLSPMSGSPMYLGPDPRLTLDLMFLSCRLTQDLSFFKKSGLLLDFIISEGTNRPITLFLKRSGTRVNVSKFPKLTVLTTANNQETH